VSTTVVPYVDVFRQGVHHSVARRFVMSPLSPIMSQFRRSLHACTASAVLCSCVYIWLLCTFTEKCWLGIFSPRFERSTNGNRLSMSTGCCRYRVAYPCRLIAIETNRRCVRADSVGRDRFLLTLFLLPGVTPTDGSNRGRMWSVWGTLWPDTIGTTLLGVDRCVRTF